MSEYVGKVLDLFVVSVCELPKMNARGPVDFDILPILCEIEFIGINGSPWKSSSSDGHDPTRSNVLPSLYLQFYMYSVYLVQIPLLG